MAAADGHPASVSPVTVTSVRLIETLRVSVFGTGSEELDNVAALITTLTDASVEGRSWFRVADDAAWRPADGDPAELSDVLSLARARGVDSGFEALPHVMTDTSRFVALAGADPVPGLDGVGVLFRFGSVVPDAPERLVIVTMELIMGRAPGVPDELSGEGALPLEDTAALVEHLLYATVRPLAAPLLFQCGLVPDELVRTVLDRSVVPAKFYAYELDAAGGPLPSADPLVQMLCKVHLGRFGHQATNVQSSVIDDDVLVFRRLLERSDSFVPLYLLVSSGAAHDPDAVLSSIDLMGAMEATLAYQLWDVSSDVRMHQDHLHEHWLAARDGRVVINDLTSADTEQDVRLAQRILTTLDQAAVELADDLRRTTQQLRTFQQADRSIVSLLDERRVDGSTAVSDVLVDGGLLGRVRTELDVARDEWSRIQTSYEYLQESAGRLAEDVRARELARLERQGAAMNVLLGLLAVVLAFEALFDFRYNAPDGAVIWTLRVLTAVAAGLALIGIVVSLVRRLRRRPVRGPTLPPFLADVLAFTTEVAQATRLGFDTSNDRSLAERFCQLWDRRATEQGSRVVMWGAERMLRAARPAYLYRGPYPWLATAYMAAFGISAWEFERTVFDWGFVPVILAPRLRSAISEARAAVTPGELLAALDAAGAGRESDAEAVLAEFRSRVGLPAESSDDDVPRPTAPEPDAADV